MTSLTVDRWEVKLDAPVFFENEQAIVVEVLVSSILNRLDVAVKVHLSHRLELAFVVRRIPQNDRRDAEAVDVPTDANRRLSWHVRVVIVLEEAFLDRRKAI